MKPKSPEVEVNASTVLDSLNSHGSFLKKAILLELNSTPGIKVLDEEIGSSFGGTRVADIVAYDSVQAIIGRRARTAYYIIECKRVHSDRVWVFLSSHSQIFRGKWELKNLKYSSDKWWGTEEPRVTCSEGYEFMKGGKKPGSCDQDPVFEAASQLAAAYLGFIRETTPIEEEDFSFVPILVTTAELFIARHEPSGISLDTGRLDQLNLESRDWLRLKHPFPTPEGFTGDFRTSGDEMPTTQMRTETIYVVRANALKAFLTPDQRDYFLGSG